ncbi:uncharacterized protein STEHIDRAFT_152618 [Stereum hirsutum FP-91666 SS1]|uniref:uncharacterized protein n=1 Tax=Stereum hirsutum (strain FP-91666) TaxID=721885 RepID=UPI000440EC1C|nr:uncharacterized protein STEHIDRAFT_152618 [Stereum hirsutum FP-91666 SS1]EIM90934.1 hypothetical protein STEHIDRAFT_152618 [Stereum hirsutum FP-91666 SS1]
MSTAIATSLPRTMAIPRDQEVIDVDLLDDDDDDDVVFLHRSVRRRLDEDGSYVSPSSSSSHSTRGRLISPPPPARSGTIPPVPPIPANLRFSRSRSREPSATGLIRPNERPFSFEHRFRPQTRARENVRSHNAPAPAPVPAPAAARPSHHVPNMGFGGAILRQNAEEATRNRSNLGSGFLNRLFPRFGTWIGWDDGDEAMEDALDVAAMARAGGDPHWSLQAHDALFNAPGDHFGSHFRRKQPDYKPMYTHPRLPADGFTHSFAPPAQALTPPSDVIDLDDEPGPSSPTTDINTTLVCANCLHPLVLGDGVTSDQEAKDRKLWGLRCGHILDGKCIDIVMRKPSTPPPSDIAGEDVEVAAERVDEAGDDVEKKGRKGKGKAVSQLYPWSELGLHLDSEGNLSTVGIRSRLRPRNNSGTVVFPSVSTSPSNDTDSADPSSNVTDTSSASTSSPVRRAAPTSPIHRRLAAVRNGSLPNARAGSKGKGKGKGKVREPRIEERYEWKCPVAKCGRTHVSLKLEGKGWVMDEKAGAIGVFV